MWMARLAVVILLVGCTTAPVGVDAGTDSGMWVPADGGVISFTQATGCQNDGFVEFCLPNDQRVLAEVLAINPAIYQLLDAHGRANCDTTWEHLYFFPTPQDDTSICLAPLGAMSDATWNQILALSKIPEIRAIVPTFFE